MRGGRTVRFERFGQGRAARRGRTLLEGQRCAVPLGEGMLTVRVNDRVVPAESGDTLFDCADRAQVRLPSSCGRRGSCHECIVQVMSGAHGLTPPTDAEAFLRGRFRLACQCRLTGAADAVHIQGLRRGTPQIVTGGRRVDCAHEPAATLDADGTVRLDGQPAGRSQGALLGVAADIGTTTVVARLVDLQSGAVLAAESFENPQLFGGTDVMGRISYDRDHPGRELQKVLVAYLNRAIEEMTAAAGVAPDDIFETVVVGNATMRDLFFGLDVRSIGERPYRSVVEDAWRRGERPTTAVEARPTRLKLRMNRGGRVWGAPLIACHVGADTTAALAAIGMDQEEQTVMLVDLGTNTEVVVGNRHRALCASCPAGPAFEGGGVACGMPGLEGAIESLRLNGAPQYRTIGGVPPQGICGSGLIDALGELLRAGLINPLGRLQLEGGRWWIDREHDIYLTDRDISELAQAKAANIAGQLILLERFGIGPEDVDRVDLAGGFAQYLSPEQAVRIGLVIDVPLERIRRIGNAAIEGATMMLCNAPLRARIEAFVRRIEHVELEQHPDFFGFFVEGCQFKPASAMIRARS